MADNKKLLPYSSLTREDLDLLARLGDTAAYSAPMSKEFMPGAPPMSYDITEDPTDPESLRRLQSSMDARDLASHPADSMAELAKGNVENRQPLLDTLRTQASVGNAHEQNQDRISLPKSADLVAEAIESKAPPKRQVASSSKSKAPKAAPAVPTEMIKPEIPSSILELLEAQKASNNISGVNNLIGAGQTINEALTRNTYSRAPLEQIAKGANEPVQQYKDRQAADMNDLKLDQERNKAEAHKVMSDPNHPTSTMMRDMLKKVGINVPPDMSAAQMEAMGISYNTIINAQAKKEMAEILRGQKATVDAEKKEQQAAALRIPGFELDPKYKPKETDVTKLREGLARKGRLLDAAKELKSLYAAKGPELLYGDEHDLMAKKVNDLLLEYKEAANLGVLQKMDERVLKEIIPDPTTLKEFLKGGKGGVSPSSFEKRLADFTNKIEKDASGNLALRGYRPEGGGQERPTASMPNSGEEQRLTRDGKLAVFDKATKQFIRYAN